MQDGVLVLVDTDLRLGRPFCSVADLKSAVALEVEQKHFTSRSTFGRGGFYARSPAHLRKELEDDIRDRMRCLLSGRAADQPPRNTSSVIQAAEASLLGFAEKAVCLLYGMGVSGTPMFVPPQKLTPEWLAAMTISSQPSIEYLCDGKKLPWDAGAVLVLVADTAADRGWSERFALAAACLRAATMATAHVHACPIIWACCKTAESELCSCPLTERWRHLVKVLYGGE